MGGHPFDEKSMLALTPSTARDYLVLSTALYTNSNVKTALPRFTEVQTVIDGVVHAKSRQFPTRRSGWIQFASHQVVNLPATPHAIKIQYNTTHPAAAASIKQARVLALPLGAVHTVAQQPEVPLDKADTAFADVLDLSFTAAAEPHLVIATGEVANGEVKSAVVARLAHVVKGDEVDQGELSFTPPAFPRQMWLSYATLRVIDLPPGPQTFKLQIKTTSSGGAAASVKSARVTAIPLGTLLAQRGLLSTLLSGRSEIGYGEAEPATATGSTDLDEKLRVAISSASSRPHAIFGVGFLGSRSPTADVSARLEVDGEESGERIFRPSGPTSDRPLDYVPLFTFKRLDRAPRTATLKYRTSTAGGSTEAHMKNARVLMLPL